ncbi:MAG: hypothetical protein AB7F86_05935 [Bdellovibrionales bacterium]
MPNVLAIAKDFRVRRQIEQYLKELGYDDLRYAIFENVREFEEIYFRAPEPPPEPPPEGEAPPPEPVESETELRLFSEVHLIIYALDTIPGKASQWLTQTRQKLIQFKKKPADGNIRWIILKYEDDGISKLDLLHPALDDLIYLPLDRLVFLQKTEIILALPSLATPSFLFNQEVKLPIEISKIVKMDRLSDVAMGIRNPYPLKKLTPGQFYLTLPGEKNRIEIKGKVIRSEPHPEHPEQFLVYFSYFALPKVNLTQIRRTLSKSPSYKSLLSDDREYVRHRPDDLFATEESNRVFTVAIIDPDEQSGRPMAQFLAKDMDRLMIGWESSYSYFLHRVLSPGGSSDRNAEPPNVTNETDFYTFPIALSVTSDEKKCLSVDPGPDEPDNFLGHHAMSLFSSPDRWWTIFQEQESKIVMEESIELAAKGREVQKVLIVNDVENKRRAISVKVTKSTVDHIVNVEFSPAGLDAIMEKMTADQTSKSLDVMIVDTNFVPEDAYSWIEGLRTRALQLNLIQKPEDLAFILVADGNPSRTEDWFTNPNILAMLMKPVDHRQLLFLISEQLTNRNTLYNFHNLGWSEPGISVHLSKEVELESLSEFGARIRSKQKLVPGTVVYLRKSIYENAPNGCIAARVYVCKEHPDGEGYQVFLTYFGINEAFLKYARTWIRENYAQQKSKES